MFINYLRRHYTTIYNFKIEKKFSNYKNRYGRNNTGKITVRFKKRGHKKIFRPINFNFQKNFNAIVYSIQHDPNRNSNIASIFNFKLNTFLHIISPKNLKVGNIIKNGVESTEKIGHTMPLIKAPIGYPLYNISFKPYDLSKISRSAGTYSIITGKTEKNCILTLSSGNKKTLPINSFCTIGIVSNEFFFLKQLNKAGKSFWLGKKPKVRGVAMNPVDHPNGGGEGKKSSKKKSLWGKFIKFL